MASSFLMMTDCDKKEYTFSRINYKEFILIDDEKQIQRGPKEGESKLVLNFNSNHHFVRNFNKTFQENNLQNMFLVKEKQEEGRSPLYFAFSASREFAGFFLFEKARSSPPVANTKYFNNIIPFLDQLFLCYNDDTLRCFDILQKLDREIKNRSLFLKKSDAYLFKPFFKIQKRFHMVVNICRKGKIGCMNENCNYLPKFFCSACRNAYYCCYECQLQDWRVCHKRICHK